MRYYGAEVLRSEGFVGIWGWLEGFELYLVLSC